MMKPKTITPPNTEFKYWSLSPEELVSVLKTPLAGLSGKDARQRLDEFGPNTLRAETNISSFITFLRQIRSPLVLLLLFAAVVSAFTGEVFDALIVGLILATSVGMSFIRERGAQVALQKLKSRLTASARVLRDGHSVTIPVRDIVPGDLILLSAGDIIPADGVLTEANDLFVNQSVLTGESFPVTKRIGAVAAETDLSARANCVFSGTHVRSGMGRFIAVHTGPASLFGGLAHRLSLRPPETEFDRGLRQFGYLLMTAMLVMVIVVFAINVLFGRPPVETLLFSVALAVGLEPELLPAILSFNLAQAAKTMATKGVLVRSLNAIENLGSMDILCTDKTGTLTEGNISLVGAFDTQGHPSSEVLEWGRLNAFFQKGIKNPLDDALLQSGVPDVSHCEKLAEIPYDFVRKKLSVVIRNAQGLNLVTKGAFEHVIDSCTTLGDGTPLDDGKLSALREQFRSFSERGIRVLGVATREIASLPNAHLKDCETELAFRGFLAFSDQPKPGIAQTITALKKAGVAIKVITGDNGLVSLSVAQSIGLACERILTGKDLDELHDEALWTAAENTDLFVEVDPNQKERIILALKKKRHVVGFLGDGINDAPAMHAADAGISVDQANDVAKDAADFVLLEKDLNILLEGILDGRVTFANTLKYLLTTMSANLGNMISMAVASLFLPFFPLTAGQILLNNLLSDIPAIGLATDRVDADQIAVPRRWDMEMIGRFMIEFGLLSSLFDLFTFAMLLAVFHADVALFRTGWFVESLLTELLVALIIRTKRRCYQSVPGNTLAFTTLAIVGLALIIPYLPFSNVIGFKPLPLGVLSALIGITLAYVAATEVVKDFFYGKKISK